MLNPCKLDHNGECLICDCTIDDCAWNRYINNDFRYESKEELEVILGIKKFDDDLSDWDVTLLDGLDEDEDFDDWDER